MDYDAEFSRAPTVNDTPVIVGPDAKPLRKPKDTSCPGVLPSGFRCGAGPDKRIASGGFGIPHPVCRVCGHEWHGEMWHG